MGADHYGVLGVERAASRKEIRAAYLRLARKHHPDRAGGSDDRMAAVNEAWEVLSDDRRRRRHDRGLARRDAVSRAPMAPVIRTAPSAGTGPVDYDPVVPARTFRLLRWVPWLLIIAVGVGLFVFSAYARSSSEADAVRSSAPVGQCVQLIGAVPGWVAVSCGNEGAGLVDQLVDRDVNCQHPDADRTELPTGLALCLLPPPR